VELRQLEIFLEVARQGTFTEAARALYISQPTISMQMAALEEELGVKLFERQGRVNALTPAGKIFLKYATDILMLRAKAVKAVSAYCQDIAGAVNIWASSVPADHLLPRFLPDFLRRYPRVFINLARSDSQRVWDKVASYAADLGVVGTLREAREIEHVPFLRDRIIVIASPQGKYGEWNTEIEVEMLLGEPFVVREAGSGTQRTFEQALAKKGFSQASLNIVARLESTEAVKAAVAAGLGLAAISELAVRQELAAGTLRGFQVKDLDLKRQFYLITHKHKVLSPAAEALRCYPMERAGEEEK